jgi:hypothetical protein
LVAVVNGKAKVVAEVRYPASLVNCETFAEVKLLVVRPETVSAPEATERPEPVRLVIVFEPTPRRVVERLVVVALVEVALVPMRLVMAPVVPLSVVKVPSVEKRLVEVALVVVAFVAVIPAKVRLGVVVELPGKR